MLVSKHSKLVDYPTFKELLVLIYKKRINSLKKFRKGVDILLKIGYNEIEIKTNGVVLKWLKRCPC